MSDSTNSKTNRTLSIAGIVISLCSLLVAVSSLGLTVYAGYWTRYHNRLSLTPRLYFFPERTDQDPQVGLLLSNSGLGPALIRSWTVSVDDKPVGTLNDGFLKAIQELKMPGKEVHYASFLVLEAGKKEFILSINQEQWKNLGEQDQKAFLNGMKRIKVVIDYDSVYNERQQCIFGTGQW